MRLLMLEGLVLLGGREVLMNSLWRALQLVMMLVMLSRLMLHGL